MSPGTEALLEVSAALGARDAEALDAALRRAAREADTPAVEEALLQSYLFLGYPAALEAFALWRRVGGPEAGPAVEPELDRTGWGARGEDVCERVYGGAYPGLRANVRSLHPDMERWMVEEGYGKVLGRPGLPLPTRELCIVALLAALDAPRQLHSHLRGALNVGAAEAEVEAALDAAAEVSDTEVAGRSRARWDAVRTRWNETRES